MQELQKCPNCAVTVIPAADGLCPSCRHSFYKALQAGNVHLNQNPYVSSPSAADGSSMPRGVHAAAIAVLAMSLVMAICTIVSAFGFYRFHIGRSEDQDTNFTLIYSMSATYMFLLIGSLVSITGGICMLTQRSRVLALAGAFALVIPGGCFLIGIPVGVWAIRVLNRPEVKSCFR
ncbi:MAG: hypothetical protein HYV60_07080 [Planctomycetia bacterium]|nr:hypothetical protein [Planctomycetia bacterium]